MKLTAAELYNKLVHQDNIINQTGFISFTMKDFSVKIVSKDTVGNLLQDWLKEWMKQESIEFEVNPNSQVFPDVYLDKDNKKTGLLEIKTFDLQRGPGFDLANFDSYCNSLLTDSYRLDSDYLIIAYTMNNHEITIKNIWLKKIWEVAGASGTYPLKVQEKKNIIYNIRPIIWYSIRSKFKGFDNKEMFLKALNDTRYKYPQTRFGNAHWLANVIKNYKEHTGETLTVE